MSRMKSWCHLGKYFFKQELNTKYVLYLSLMTGIIWKFLWCKSCKRKAAAWHQSYHQCLIQTDTHDTEFSYPLTPSGAQAMDPVVRSWEKNFLLNLNSPSNEITLLIYLFVYLFNYIFLLTIFCLRFK